MTLLLQFMNKQEKTPIIWSTEKRNVKDLLPSSYNPRKMTESERRDLESSIKEFGTVVPVVLNAGTRSNFLIGGHQRVIIYADLGITEIDAMIPNRELDEREEQTLNLRLNKNLGSWDEAMLKETGFKTKSGKLLTLGNIYRLLRMTFFYGVFEYPEKSGEWYTGKHTPIITRELFEAAQEKIKVEKKKTYGREFAFTSMLHCAYCASGITAEEKIKVLKDGGSNAHVYYRCTKVKDRDCPNESVKEALLIDEMLLIIEKMNLDRTELKQKLEKEVARYALFQTGVLKQDLQQSKKRNDINIKTFAKYMLQHGTMLEKREVLSCIKSRILLKDKKLTME